MKQTIEIGSIIAMYRNVEIGDDLPLEVGDYVVAVRASHGWGDVQRGMVGRVITAGRHTYDVDFGRYHSEWTGERYCFIKLGKELSGDILKQVEKAQNENFLQKLEQIRKEGQEDFIIDTSLVVHSLRYRDVAKVRITVPMKEITRLRTFKGFRNRMVQILANNVSSEVHPTRIRKVGELHALGYSLSNISTDELMSKLEV